MANGSIWRLQGRFAGPALFAIIAVPATFFAFVISVAAGRTFSGLAMTPILHVHLALASLWVVMLASQAWLARAGKIPLHRSVGRASYVLAPLIFASMALVYAEFLGRRPYPYDELTLQFDIFNWLTPIGFILFWGLAIRHRKNTPLHMRYMVSTLFAVGSAIVFRLLLNYFAWVPGFTNNDVLITVNGLILILPLVWLIRRDNAQGIRPSPYWLALGLNLLLVIGYFTFTKSEAWSNFVNGFATIAAI